MTQYNIFNWTSRWSYSVSNTQFHPHPDSSTPIFHYTHIMMTQSSKLKDKSWELFDDKIGSDDLQINTRV